MIDQGSAPSLMGSTVRDSAGGKIGKVGQVYLDDITGQPEWVTVRTGLFGTRESFVPLAAARVEGDELVVDVTKDQVTDAPKMDEDGHLSEEQEAELYTYYGVSAGAFGSGTGPTDGYPTTDAGPRTGYEGAPAVAAAEPVPPTAPPARPPAADVLSPMTDGAAGQVAGEPAPAGRARLRRYQAGPAAPAAADPADPVDPEAR